MKIALSVLILFVSQISFGEVCFGEAQVVSGFISSVTATSRGTCLVKIQGAFEYRLTSACPIYYNEVSHEGIETQSCNYRVGGEITGQLIRDNSGRIILNDSY